MRLLFSTFLILWFASVSAQFCGYSREFAVDNCTACPTLDHARGDVHVAVCEEREARAGVGTAYACVCLDFPNADSGAPLRYYPRIEGNTTRCASSWSRAPRLNAAVLAVGACVVLYAATHMMYIVVVSGMCSCKKNRCTKTNFSALFFCIHQLCWLSIWLCFLPAQSEGDLGDIWHGFYFGHNLFQALNIIAFNLAAALLYTSVADMVFGGDDVAGWRNGINITFGILSIGSSVLVLFSFVGNSVGIGLMWTDIARDIDSYLKTITYLFSSVFMVVAHCKMHAVVRKHSEQKTKPALVIKLEQLCGAICRYYYPQWILVFIVTILYSARQACPGASAVSPVLYWILEMLLFICVAGVAGEFNACILEGKRVPTFPGCLCRKKSANLSPSLQFTSSLGKALALLTKHGLDTERRKEFPVEVAMESLLSTSPLMVAAAPDMDLMSCIEHFLERCVDGEGKIATKFAEMPVGNLLRGGWKQHVLTAADIPKLRGKAKKCLQWAQDPARPAIANTTVDEAAAIQLYTQHCCLYPLLNNALRDHAHPENLKAFLPYLKLLLKGLNKLPLLRTKVYRGVNMDLHEEYNQLQGRTFRWWAFSSTTQRESATASFLGTTGSTLFKIDGIGVDIAAFSAFPNESEVLLLPGTCLVVESGVMVKDNHWEFQASVCDAAQQQRQQLQQHNEANDEGGAEGTPASDRDDHDDSTQHFQYTDLPHPGWEEVVYPMKTSYVPDGNVIIVGTGDATPEGSHLGRERPTDANPEANHLRREKLSDATPEADRLRRERPTDAKPEANHLRREKVSDATPEANHLRRERPTDATPEANHIRRERPTDMKPEANRLKRERPTDVTPEANHLRRERPTDVKPEGNRGSHFQKTDIPHPGCEQIVYINIQSTLKQY